VLHHVTLEVAPADIDALGAVLEAVGFRAVPAPASLGERFRWFERGGTQVHLELADEPDVPSRGHAALVVPDLEEAIGRVEALGHGVEERRRHWDARRVVVRAPGGHRIELMEAPPGEPSRRSRS